ncbi:sugar phosphate isomerase/epimerase family protein [Mesobacillus maritimus]|uniref:TIM barrel protein n=1 Tax=Mesobacillus maritimus TaxID=1643336 RepID=A0ABS7KA98_9BACI|nr:TIM barrel protein [Mesobacillus maritimus]MBY0099199.1 TIM barrel protein [Mesobacillus maritimus]
MTKIILPTLIFKESLSLEQQVTRIKEYGADGIEVRRERLKDISTELERFKASIKASGLETVVYSVPTELFLDSHTINPVAVTSMKEAELLQATHIKFSLGRFHADHANVDRFQAWLATNLPKGMKLLIENDQSTYGGTLQPMLSFFQWVRETSVRMTFDVGNWTVNEEDWQEAYNRLNPWIEYLHLKSVQKTKEGWVSLPVLNKHFSIPFPTYTAIEFPLTNPNTEGPQWVEKMSRTKLHS